MRKILFIAHYFPPTGGPGVQRAAKFVKYLPGFGIQPIVVTDTTTSEGRWTPQDKTLLEDIPPETVVYRARWEKSADWKIGRRRRYESLLKAAKDAVSDHQPELIFVTMSPFDDAEVAAAVAAQHGIPWVADLRDPWALDEFQVHRTYFHRLKSLWSMRSALRTSAAIVMNTPTAKRSLIEAFPEWRKRPVTSITNGFDADDFLGQTPSDQRGKFRIVHTGSFHTKAGMHQLKNRTIFRLLGRCASGVRLLGRSPFYLLQALEAIAESDPMILQDMEVIFAGVMSEEDVALIQQSKVRSCVTVTGYIDHIESISYLKSADLLFLPLHKVGRRSRATIVPGKTYEYLAAGKPILAALPDGDARDYVDETGDSWITDPESCSALAEGIRHFYNRERHPGSTSVPGSRGLAKFERRNLTAQLATFLSQILDGRPALEAERGTENVVSKVGK